jgi:hypothetical protein
MSELQSLAIQLRAYSNDRLFLSADEREEVSSLAGNNREILWLPEKSKKPVGQQLASETLVLLFLLGSTFLVKFFEGFAGAAGEDLWNLVKKITGRIWHRQAEKTYDLKGSALVIVRLEENFVGIELGLPRVSTQAFKDPEFSRTMDEQLAEIAGQWDTLIARINEEHARAVAEGRRKFIRTIGYGEYRKIIALSLEEVAELTDADSLKW